MLFGASATRLAPAERVAASTRIETSLTHSSQPPVEDDSNTTVPVGPRLYKMNVPSADQSVGMLPNPLLRTSCSAPPSTGFT